MEKGRKRHLVRLQNQEDSDRQCEPCGTLHSSQKDLKHRLQLRRKGADRDASTASQDNKQSGTLPHLKLTEGEVKRRKSFGRGERCAEMSSMRHKTFTLPGCAKDLTDKSHSKTRHTDQSGDEPLKLMDKQSLGIHAESKPLKYCDCGRQFTRDILKVHQKTDTVDRPFPCPICGKRFAQKSSVSKHQRTHTGEKPFVCPTCGKKFTQKGSMTKHQIIHTGEKPFVCPNCPKKFKGKDDLKVHLKRHQGKKALVCPDCGKKFTVKSSLTLHIRMHTREKPYQCHLCGKRFARNRYMKMHQRRKLLKCGKQILQKNLP